MCGSEQCLCDVMISVCVSARVYMRPCDEHCVVQGTWGDTYPGKAGLKVQASDDSPLCGDCGLSGFNNSEMHPHQCSNGTQLLANWNSILDILEQNRWISLQTVLVRVEMQV